MLLADRVPTRLGYAQQCAALSISGEAQGGSTAEEWASRQALAHQVLSGTVSRFESSVLALIGAGSSVAALESEITDGELDTAVAAIWNDVAGISAT